MPPHTCNLTFAFCTHLRHRAGSYLLDMVGLPPRLYCARAVRFLPRARTYCGFACHPTPAPWDLLFNRCVNNAYLPPPHPPYWSVFPIPTTHSIILVSSSLCPTVSSSRQQFSSCLFTFCATITAGSNMVLRWFCCAFTTHAPAIVVRVLSSGTPSQRTILVSCCFCHHLKLLLVSLYRLRTGFLLVHYTMRSDSPAFRSNFLCILNLTYLIVSPPTTQSFTACILFFLKMTVPACHHHYATCCYFVSTVSSVSQHSPFCLTVPRYLPPTFYGFLPFHTMLHYSLGPSLPTTQWPSYPIHFLSHFVPIITFYSA